LSSSNDLNFEFALLVLIRENFDRFPAVLITLVNRAESMSLTRLFTAKSYPFLDRLILLPGIVTSEDLDSWKIGCVKDFILFVQKSYGVFGGLIFVDYLLNLGDESLVFSYILVLLDHLSMSSRKSFDVIKVLLMSLLVDPWILYFDFLWLKSIMLFLGQK
jgi:hypothetical protein